MAEVFTISGADPIEMGLPASELDVTCAENVKGVLIAGGVMKIGAIPLGLFGTYKMFKAHWAAGVTSLLGTGVLWFLGGSLVAGAARSFEQCRKP